MENAVEAIKMAFAVIVFVMALSIAIYMFSEAKQVADIMVYRSDDTRYIEYGQEGQQEGDSIGVGTENRTVGMETIVPTLYKYYKENYTVVFRERNKKFMVLYNTKTDSNNWSNNYKYKKYDGLTDKTQICSFDMDEETSRYEPWTGSTEEYKKNLDTFLAGGVYNFPDGSGKSYIYTGFMNRHRNEKFIESLGEYSYGSTNENVKRKKKRVIIYTLI